MFYDNLKKVCEDNKIKPTKLLEILNISTGSLGNWKKGALPKSEILIKISTHLNVSTDFLLFGTTNMSINNLSIDELNIIEMYRDMNNETKKELQSTMRVMWAENRSPKSKSSTYSEEKINNTIA